MLYIEKQNSHFVYVRNKISEYPCTKVFLMRLITHASVTTTEKYLKEGIIVKYVWKGV